MEHCEKYWDMISAQADGELSEAESAELFAHLEACPDCRELFSLLEQSGGIMPELMEEPPEGLVEGVMYKVSLESGGKKRFSFGRFTAVAAMLAVVLFAVYAFPGLFGNKSDEALESGAGNSAGSIAPMAGDSGESAQFHAADEGAGTEADSGVLFDGATRNDMADDAAVPENGLAQSAEPAQLYGAPALPYAGEFSAILVCAGEPPEELLAYPMEQGAETEIYFFVPTENAGELIDSGLYQVYTEGDNISETAANAIVVVYGGLD